MNSRNKAVNWIFGAGFSICLVVGFQLEVFHQCEFTSPWTYILMVIFTPAFSYLTRWLWDMLIKIYANRRVKEVNEPKHNVFFSSSVAVWVMHFIVFLGVYPGFFTYDAQDELMQTVTRSFNTHHPLIHVLSMGGLVQGGHKLTGSYNFGIALFILFGMTVSAVGYGFLVSYLRKKGMGKAGALILTVLYGVFPVFVMYSLCSTKDGIFGILVVLAFIYLKKMTENPEEFFSDHKRPIGLTILTVLLMLYRNNGCYAYLAFVLLTIIVFLKKADYRKYIKRFIAFSVIGVASFLLINSALCVVTKAQKEGYKEILSVPIMQLSRVYCYDSESLTAEEKAEITAYIPEEAVMRYDPKISDLVKAGFNEEHFSKDKAGFFKIWIKVGLKSPQAYFNAFLMTNYGMWYPWATIDGYRGHQMFTFTYGDSSYFGYEVEEPGYRDSKIPIIDRIYRWLSLDVTIQKLPVVHLLFSPGFLLWVTLFLAGFMVYAGKGIDALAYGLPLMLVLTCLLGPMSLVRYTFYLWITVPFMIMEINIKRCYTGDL